MPPACTPGEALCECLNGTTCNSGVQCVFGECPDFTGQCPWEGDQECDEGGACAEGTDPFDCCATKQDGNCEEHNFGGACSKGTDWWDCGYCPWVDDGECDDNIYCPAGTDVNDCCATPNNGTCEEMSQGGECPDGTDPFDCGACETQFDGVCDEPGACPVGSDSFDCCSTPKNGVCEEEQAGGECPNGTDPYDCGVCQWVDDGVCDEPGLCAPGSDAADCCATAENGVCEEMSQGGECPDGSDPWDCGFCQWTNDNECDEPDLCPPGSDSDDCCAVQENGVCEEMSQGGQCPDGTDPWDCGFCQWTNDGECDEPNLCPPGSDAEDCA